MSEQATNYSQESSVPAEGEKTKVIKGKALIDKPNFVKKVIGFLFSDRLDSVGNYLTVNVVRPALKDLLYKAVVGATQMAIYDGGQSAGGVNVPGYGGYSTTARRDPIPYNMMGTPYPYGYPQQSYGYGYAQPQPQPAIYTQKLSLSDISFESRDDALTVIDRMVEEIRKYQKVRAADFYTFAGITGQESNWTLQSNGWYDLTGAKPLQRTDGRWIVDLPPATVIR